MGARALKQTVGVCPTVPPKGGWFRGKPPGSQALVEGMGGEGRGGGGGAMLKNMAPKTGTADGRKSERPRAILPPERGSKPDKQVILNLS